jgi:thioredoxin reductase
MGATATSVRERGGRINLELSNGTSRSVDHVLLATGYSIDLANEGFLTPFGGRIKCEAGSPVLSMGMESSIPGLYFTGAAAVRSHGPLLRFVAGTSYASTALSLAIRRSRGARSIPIEGAVPYEPANA